MEQKAFIASCAGTTLTDRERAFFAEARPCGLIVFARNCQTPDQLRALTSAFKHAVGNDEVLLLIDQEGGRVQRLRPPHWRDMPAARCYGRLYADDPARGKEAAFAGARLTADGRLRLCLLREDEVDLLTPLRQGASAREIRQMASEALWRKPWGHGLAAGKVPLNRVMSEIGG